MDEADIEIKKYYNLMQKNLVIPNQKCLIYTDKT